MKKFLAMLMTLVCVIGCMFALASCGDEEEKKPTSVDAESVVLNKTELTLEVGENETLTATVSPETAVDKTVTWESSAPEIASVDGGKVTAKAAGTATITAKTSNDKSATCTVTVKLTLTEQTDFASLKSDKVTETEWKAAFSENSLVNFTAKAVNGDVTMILQRQTEGTDKFVCLSMAEGEYSDMLYATIEGGKKYIYMNEEGRFFRIEFKGEDGWVEEAFTLYMSHLSLLPDLSKEYSKFAYDEQKNAYTYGGEGIDCNVPFGDGTFTYTDITLKIVDGKLAYISCYRVGDDENGHHSDGEYVFTVYNYGKTTVTLPTECGDGQAESVALNKTELTLEVGENETLTATVSPEIAVDQTVTWTSSAPEIASVDGGKVTAKAAGSATITAKTSNDKSATCTVTVKLALTEQTDFASLKSDKVTETQWKAAFSENSLVNFTAKAVNGDVTRILQRQAEGTDKFVCLNMAEGKYSDMLYATIEGGKKYIYTNEEGGFLRIEFKGEDEREEEAFGMYMSHLSLIPDLSKEYSKFAYDEQKNAYTYGGEGIDCNVPFGDTYTDITLKIVDGKLAYISCYRVGDDENGHHSDGEYVFTVYNYGKTTVTLPTDYTEQEGA